MKVCRKFPNNATTGVSTDNRYPDARSLAVVLGILALKWKVERDNLAEELRTLQGR